MINEHKSCGKPLEPSGFSYDPIEFTKNNSKLDYHLKF
jgi:hypothetical protein